MCSSIGFKYNVQNIIDKFYSKSNNCVMNRNCYATFVGIKTRLVSSNAKVKSDLFKTTIYII